MYSRELPEDIKKELDKIIKDEAAPIMVTAKTSVEELQSLEKHYGQKKEGELKNASVDLKNKLLHEARAKLYGEFIDQVKLIIKTRLEKPNQFKKIKTISLEEAQKKAKPALSLAVEKSTDKFSQLHITFEPKSHSPKSGNYGMIPPAKVSQIGKFAQPPAPPSKGYSSNYGSIPTYIPKPK